MKILTFSKVINQYLFFAYGLNYTLGLVREEDKGGGMGGGGWGAQKCEDTMFN